MGVRAVVLLAGVLTLAGAGCGATAPVTAADRGGAHSEPFSTAGRGSGDPDERGGQNPTVTTAPVTAPTSSSAITTVIAPAGSGPASVVPATPVPTTPRASTTLPGSTTRPTVGTAAPAPTAPPRPPVFTVQPSIPFNQALEAERDFTGPGDNLTVADASNGQVRRLTPGMTIAATFYTPHWMAVAVPFRYLKPADWPELTVRVVIDGSEIGSFVAVHHETLGLGGAFRPDYEFVLTQGYHRVEVSVSGADGPASGFQLDYIGFREPRLNLVVPPGLRTVGPSGVPAP